MTDLTTITTPFGLLDAETQEALKAHGGPYEWWSGGEWFETATCDDVNDKVHRVKAAAPKPREWWMFHTGGLEGFRVFDHEDHAMRACGGRHITHVREVLP